MTGRTYSSSGGRAATTARRAPCRRAARQPVGQRPRRTGADRDHGCDVVDRQRRHPGRAVGDVERERHDLLVRVARGGEEGAVRLAADMHGDDHLERASVVRVGGGQAVGPVAGVGLPGAIAEVDRPTVGVDRARDDVGADRLIEVGAPAGREVGAHRPLGPRRRGYGIDRDIEVQAHVRERGAIEPDRRLWPADDRRLRVVGVDRDAIARAVDDDPDAWQKGLGLPMFCHSDQNSVSTALPVADGGAQWPVTWTPT